MPPYHWLRHHRRAQKNHIYSFNQALGDSLMMVPTWTETCWSFIVNYTVAEHWIGLEFKSDHASAWQKKKKPYIFISIVKTNSCTASQIYFILEQHSTCFGRSFRQSSGVYDCTYSIRYKSYRFCDCFLADAVCTVLDSWWWTERPSETCRVLF
jgi:hypothetical protein